VSGVLIDTHTHLDDSGFADDLDSVIASSRLAGVTQWINVGYSPESWQSTLELASHVEGMGYMLGMHPGHADEWDEKSERLLSELIDANDPVAIGEIGLDLHWRQDNLAIQTEAFTCQLKLAVSATLPAVIHMRASDVELLEILGTVHPLPHLHFHSFDGDVDLRNYVLEHECTIGVGGLMTRKDSESLRTWIADIPRDRVVLETDSPYLKPQGIRGRRNEPAFVTRVAERLSQLWSISRSETSTITTGNARRIFHLKLNG